MSRSLAAQRFEARWATQQDFIDLTTALITEFEDELPAGTVIRCVARVRAHLLGAGVRGPGLAVAAESLARLRLSDRVRAPRSAG